MNISASEIPGTILWIAPFYNRSGYGVGARAMALALHRAGLRIRIMASNQVEPGIDDCDMDLLRSLEKTPPVPPITLLIFHVPDPGWLNLKLPEPGIRILSTTFDGIAQGGAPNPGWVEVCQQIDQIWLTDEREKVALQKAGVAEHKLQIVPWPHLWLDNPDIPTPKPESIPAGKLFRFFSVGVFQPRLRWNLLIEAFLKEFQADEAELYLKVRYPSWHPEPEKPRRELLDLISELRNKTGSNTPIVVDESLGTRLQLIELFDRCNVYVSTDINNTAPLVEAIVRKRMLIVPAGLGVPGSLHFDVDLNKRQYPTKVDLLYKAHYDSMSALSVGSVREKMREAWEMSPEEREMRCLNALAFVPKTEAVVARAVSRLKKAWEPYRLQK